MLTDVEQAALFSAFRDKLLPELDERYVLHDVCNDKQSSLEKEISDDRADFLVLRNDCGTMKKLMWVITTACVSYFVTNLLGLLIRA